MRSIRTTSITLAILAGTALGTASAQEITVLIDNNPDTVSTMEAFAAAYSAANSGITFDIEIRPGGGDGDNIVKTRLATGEMPDVFNYNSGSLLHALRPTRTLEPLTDLPNIGNVIESFLQTVTNDGDVFGAPYGPAMGGGILYNIPLYEQLGLDIPTTWDAFMANNAKIAQATDAAPIAQTYSDSWTSQLFVLADYYNVEAESPGWAHSYTLNQAKYATSPAAMKGFERLQEAYEAGYFNEDFGAASYADGLQMVSSGEAAHYPMLTFAVGAIQQNHPDQLKDVGFFAQPGDNPDVNGLTVWMPTAWYVPKDAENKDAALDFVNWVASVEACELAIDTIGATGPYLIKGCELPDDVPPAVAGMLPYFQEDGRTFPALEFLSPIKGPALEQLTVEVGSGIRNASSAAELYDRDVAKQARQLGLPSW